MGENGVKRHVWLKGVKAEKWWRNGESAIGGVKHGGENHRRRR